jgi:hypothetical protein
LPFESTKIVEKYIFTRRSIEMVTAANVLIYGKDERLLETRRMVLERSGHRVRVATRLADVVSMHEDPELLIFCHTVSLEECGRVIAMCQVRWPNAKSLFMSAGSMQRVANDSGEVLDALDGPEKLVSAIARIVGGGNGLHAHFL